MKDSCLALRSGVLGLLLAAALLGVCRGQSYVRIESEAESRARRQIEEALSRTGSVDYIDAPLSAVAAELRDRLGVNVVLAKDSLADAAIASDTPVTAHISAVSYRSLLHLILKDLKLAWTIRDEVLLITTPEEADSMLETRLYPVLDLVTMTGTTPDKAMRSEQDYDTLIEAITTTIDPDSWDDVGGPGTVVEYPSAGALLISQTEEIHEHVEKVLAALRRVKQMQGIPALALPSVQSKRIRAIRRAAADTRSYSSSGAQAWQLPQVYGAE